MKLEIIAIVCPKRTPLLIPYLKGTPHKVLYTKDYALPEGFQPDANMVGVVLNHVGAYRCYKGHQDGMAIAEGDAVLMLEDDAVPNVDNWFQKVEDAIPLLDSFEVVSFHGRQRIHPFEPVPDYPEFIKPAHSPIWMVATLAYMVKKENIPKYLEYKYNGKPWDILMYQEHSFCVMENSIFEHDRSEGSLID